ncbi:Gp138 family membrane-puncturing spike protein [Anaerotruncus colihominis]|uniref:Gp138 family membrane-puncturing spike protein n=1 Tax=Anaerotruncus colihominis TaxID=169435 RepID=UPI00242FBCE1|nr:Gp138 family membrane-puncturing spike protein [Anaerotruncus colihominis]
MMQEFVQQVNKTIKDSMNGMHTAFPGTIASFDPATGLATVLPSMKFKKPDGTTVEYPQITGVPVVFPQSMGQQATIAFPIKAGDGCLVIVAEQSIDLWMYGQETNTDLAFDLTNSICIPGMFAKENAAMEDACAGNAVIVDVGGTRIAVKAGSVQVDAGSITLNGNVTVKGNLTTQGGVVNLN